MKTLLLTLMVAVAAAQVTSQEKEAAKDGVIQGKVTRPGTTEGIGEVQVILQGPTMTFDRGSLSGLYTPRADLTPDMRDQISRLIDSAPASIPPETVANAAARMEAQLLGLPAPVNIPVSGNPAGPAQAAPPAVTFMTDNDGNFSFKKLAPGRYTIRAQRDGYFGVPPAGSTGAPTTVTAPATVVAGQTTPDVMLTLVAGGIVSGYLRDPNGKAIPNLSITAYQVTYRADGRGQLSSTKSATTDDRGYYRLYYLPPGDYLIGATPRRPAAIANPQDAFARTFYPGLIDPRIVPPLAVPEAGDVTAIDIMIRPEATAKISGQIISPFVGTNGQPTAPAAAMFLLQRDPNALADTAAPNFQNLASNRTNGQFELRNVLPGSYDLLATAPDGTGRTALGRARVEVGSRDVEDVAIAIHPGVEVKARMIVDGVPPPSSAVPAPRGAINAAQVLAEARGAGIAPAEALRQAQARGNVNPDGTPATIMRSSIQLQLRSKEIYAAPFDSAANANTTFDPSGLFVFPNVPEGRYTFQVTPLAAAGAYIEDIREGGASIYDDGLLIAGGVAGEIEIVISTKGATVKGTVADAKQKPFASARIVLVPQHHRQNGALYKTTTSDTAGNFTINGVAPGEYKAFAWESVPANAWLNADFLSQHEPRGTGVTVTSGAPAMVDLNLISKDAGRR